LRWLLDGKGRPPLPRFDRPTVDGKPIDPVNEWGHDVLWWLDKMVSSRRPLVEKLTLFWHDHFSTNDQETPLMLKQNRMLRKNALARFPVLLRAVTLDYAMQLFLSLADSVKEAPNENYARELMELFTLGRGYTEDDIREAARALTGFRANWTDDGFGGIRFDPEAHDPGVKRVLHRRGRFDWEDVLGIVTEHPRHAPFLVEKLWSFFVTQPIDKATKARLVKIYRSQQLQVKPVVAEILRHPALYAKLDEPDMVKSPIVFAAGMLRTTGSSVDIQAWSWLLEGMGQVPFSPPSVAGWDWGVAWMSTNAMRTRFTAVNYLVDDDGPLRVKSGSSPASLTPDEALGRARAAVGEPHVSEQSAAALMRMAGGYFEGIRPRDEEQRAERADMLQRTLRHFLLSGPDNHLH
jgi:uncharacterized protein (DUF1800 family)